MLGLAVSLETRAQVLFTEDFEGSFPGTNWTVGDANTSGTPAYWGAVDSAFGGEGTHGGSRKGYCAAVGFAGSSANPVYTNLMTAFLRRTLDLTGQTSARLTFWSKVPGIESQYDFARVKVDSTVLWQRDTVATAWTQVVLDLGGFVGGIHTLTFEMSTDISVTAEGWYLDDIVVSVNVPPINDAFASAQALTGIGGSFPGGNANASVEPGEPQHAGQAGGHSVWYTFTAPSSGPLLFDTAGSSIDTVLAAYAGTSVGMLTTVTNNDDIDGATLQSRISFAAVAGQTYRIAVDGKNGASGPLVLNFRFGGLPDLIINAPAANPQVVLRTFAANDCEVVEGCAIPGTRRLLRFNNESWNIGSGDLYFGNPAGNPLFHYASCHGHYHFEDFAVYRLRRTNDGVVVATGGKVGFCLLDSIRISPTAAPNARYNCSNQGIQAGWGDVYTSGLPCQYIDITSVPPATYTLELEFDPRNLIAEANESNNVSSLLVTIPLDCAFAPGNNSFAGAWGVTNAPLTTNGYNACATRETNEPNHAGNSGGHSLWYRWTAPASSNYVVSTAGSDFDTVLAVYTGATLSTLATIASNDDIDIANPRSRVSFNAVAGTTYHIAVDGRLNGTNGAVGSVVLSINPPGNDSFHQGFVLAGASGETRGHTIGATREDDEPAHVLFPAQGSVWYRWTPPGSATAQFDTEGSGFDTRLAIYTGLTVETLTPVASDDDSGAGMTSRLTFPAAGGTTYHIAVDGSQGAAGQFLLQWTMQARLLAQRLPGGTFRISLSGIPGAQYRIERSSNLQVWDILTTVTAGPDGNATLDLGPIGAGEIRFCRAVSL